MVRGGGWLRGVQGREACWGGGVLATGRRSPCREMSSRAGVVAEAADAAVMTIAKDSQNTKLAGNDMSRHLPLPTPTPPPPSPRVTLVCHREIAELAKQEKIHFEARQKALKAAIKATSACKAGDSACLDAAQHINWKVASRPPGHTRRLLGRRRRRRMGEIWTSVELGVVSQQKLTTLVVACLFS